MRRKLRGKLGLQKGVVGGDGGVGVVLAEIDIVDTTHSAEVEPRKERVRKGTNVQTKKRIGHDGRCRLRESLRAKKEDKAGKAGGTL